MPMFRRAQTHAADEGERPFWISYADMMTACMTLFLVIMAAFLAVNAKSLEEKLKADRMINDRRLAIENVMGRIRGRVEKMPGVAQDEVQVRVDNQTIDMGKVCQFNQGQYMLTAAQQAKLRKYVQESVVAEYLEKSNDRRWIKSVDVVGFASREGTYLTNLGISQARSAFMVCSLLELPAGSRPEEKELFRNIVRTKFQVAAFSENNLIGTAKAANANDAQQQRMKSRRAELRVVFFSVEEMRDREKRGVADNADFDDKDNDGLGGCVDVWRVVQ